MPFGSPLAPVKRYLKTRLDRRYARVDELAELRAEVSQLVTLVNGGRPSPSTRLPAMTTGDASIRLDIFRSILEPMKPGRLLDLGTGHGKFARIAHELGWEVTAVDARTERMPMTAGIEWVQSDVRSFEVRDFEVICLLGIFYHLELGDQLDLLRRCAGSTTILDTHFATRAEVEEKGYQGRYFEENVDAPTASWRNAYSFWPTESSLIRMLGDCGYRFIFKLEPPTGPDRTFYVCH